MNNETELVFINPLQSQRFEGINNDSIQNNSLQRDIPLSANPIGYTSKNSDENLNEENKNQSESSLQRRYRRPLINILPGEEDMSHSSE